MSETSAQEPAGWRRAKAPTINDIAAEAGVSKSAVSRALLGQGQVSPATRERVEAAAARLGYVANALAAGLRSQTKTIGAVLRDINRPYYSILFAAMQQQAEQRGYRLVAMAGAGELDVASAISAVRSLVSLQVDGLILASAHLDSELIKPFIDRVPMVVAGRMERGSVPSVYGDEPDGGAQLADFVVNASHTRVAVGLVAKAYSMSQHLSGVAMIEQIIRRGATAVVFEIEDDWHTVDILETVLQDDTITALMCPTDAAMMEVLEALRLRGIAPPEGLSVSGYGGMAPLAGPYLGLTTFRQPVEEIGSQSIDLLIDIIENTQQANPTPAHTSIPGVLIPGRTIGVLSQ